MPHAYTEDQLIEQPAIGLFADLGWLTVSAFEEVFGLGGTLGREIKGEAVLVPLLRTALERLNPSTRSHFWSGGKYRCQEPFSTNRTRHHRPRIR